MTSEATNKLGFNWGALALVVATLCIAFFCLYFSVGVKAAFSLAGIMLVFYPVAGILYGRLTSVLVSWAFGRPPLTKSARGFLGAIWFIALIPTTLYLILHGAIRRLL